MQILYYSVLFTALYAKWLGILTGPRFLIEFRVRPPEAEAHDQPDYQDEDHGSGHRDQELDVEILESAGASRGNDLPDVHIKQFKICDQLHQEGGHSRLQHRGCLRQDLAVADHSLDLVPKTRKHFADAEVDVHIAQGLPPGLLPKITILKTQNKAECFKCFAFEKYEMKHVLFRRCACRKCVLVINDVANDF